MPVRFFFPDYINPSLLPNANPDVLNPMFDQKSEKRNIEMNNHRRVDAIQNPESVEIGLGDVNVLEKLQKRLELLAIGKDKLIVDFVTTPLEKQSALIESLSADLKEDLEFIFTLDNECGSELHVNAYPFSVSEITPMEHIYILFEMVKVECVFVLSGDGNMKGMISR
jgi:hypothetical protein